MHELQKILPNPRPCRQSENVNLEESTFPAYHYRYYIIVRTLTYSGYDNDNVFLLYIPLSRVFYLIS